jgi:hypothetical protein
MAVSADDFAFLDLCLDDVPPAAVSHGASNTSCLVLARLVIEVQRDSVFAVAAVSTSTFKLEGRNAIANPAFSPTPFLGPLFRLFSGAPKGAHVTGNDDLGTTRLSCSGVVPALFL